METDNSRRLNELHAAHYALREAAIAAESMGEGPETEAARAAYAAWLDDYVIEYATLAAEA